MQLAAASIETPLGAYTLLANDTGLVRALPVESSAQTQRAAASAAEHLLERACAAFASYFAGSCAPLSELPLDPQGSEFQRCVWRALREIPLGATASYGEIARRIGRPGAARAVGDANRRNPISIAIPCHRVIGGDGRLVGYAGGLARKRWLLAHEAMSAGFTVQAASSNGPAESQLPMALARRRRSAAASI
jgi:methylated-DNA-[protein]-cysteine S-methyltransferase